MNTLFYILIALVLGILLYIIFKLNNLKSNKTTENTLENLSFKMEFEKQIALLEQKGIQLAKENEQLETSVKTSTDELTDMRQKLTLAEKSFEYIEIELDKITFERNQLLSKKQILENEVNDFKYSIVSLQNDLSSTKYLLEQERVNLSKMQEKFTTDFEIIASKILEQKTEKFTNQNKIQLQELLQPLGENINSFKQKVDEVYTIEAKERFSLGEKVKELSELNLKISQEAHNLTNALKSDVKKQGNWGEMILETILERSGLEKGINYFMEHQLRDEEGKNLKSTFEDKKMRPDAVIKYPDQRSVIIDSKVSLNAYSKYMDSENSEDQELYLKNHIQAIKNHIVTLSNKGYDDYREALDFVMMFIPTEPAYLVALKNDPELWNYAYERRILLISPTNLITSLKLIEDLWKREYQNRNAIEIAERGGKLYDKFVGFVSNLTAVGDHIEKAQNKYNEAYKQLSTGSDNLVKQAEKLKQLGVKSKKDLPIKGLDLPNQEEE